MRRLGLILGLATLSCSAAPGTEAVETEGGVTGSSGSESGTPSTSSSAGTSSTGTSTLGTSSGAPGSSDSGGPTSGENSGTSTGDTAADYCPPTLSDAVLPWREAYDVHFSNTESMRTSLDSLPSGTGHWGQTYTLRSLVLMYELTGDLAYLHELMWQAHTLADIAGDDATWPTGVCGNTFEHSTVVIDGRFLTPLLRAGWWMQNSRLADDEVPTIDGLDFKGASYGDIAESYAVLAGEVLGGHQGDLTSIASESFGPESGSPSLYYRFPNSYSCVASDVMPFNYANSAGTAYAELWRLTGDDEARTQAEELLTFWWNRTYAYEPSPGSTRSRWYGYRGELTERFDPDNDTHRAEDLGHADMTGSFADRMFTLGLGSLNATRMDQVAMASKRWVDRVLSTDDLPSYAITNDDHEGEWRDLFDHLPMSCYRGSILGDLTALAPTELANDDGSYPRAVIENIAEFAYYTEFADSPSPCGPTCGDGVCGGAEDCVGCPADCACPTAGCD